MESEDRDATDASVAARADNHVNIMPALPSFLQEICNTPDDSPFQTDYAYMQHVLSVVLSFAMAETLNIHVVSCILGNSMSLNIPNVANCPSIYEQLIGVHDMLERKRHSRLGVILLTTGFLTHIHIDFTCATCPYIGS